MRFKDNDKQDGTDKRRIRSKQPEAEGISHNTHRGMLETIIFRFKEISRRDSDVREHAMNAMYGLGEDALPVFAEILNDRETARRVAKRILSTNSDSSHSGNQTRAEEIDPEVIEKKIITIRSGSALFLSRIGSQFDPVVKEGVARMLILSLKDPNPDVRYYSVVAFGKLGEAAHVAINPLTVMAGDKNEKLMVRQSAIELIRAMGIAAKSSINMFIGIAKDSTELSCVRRSAIETLGELGKYSEGREQNVDICNTLLDRLGEDDTFLSNEAINAFVSLDGQYNTKEIVKLVKNPSKSLNARTNAVWTLVGICGKEVQMDDSRKRAQTVDLVVPHLVELTEKSKDPASKVELDQNLLFTIIEALARISKQMY